MWFRILGGTPGAAWRALCPRSPSGRRSFGPPSGPAAPSTSHRQTAGETHCAPGPRVPTVEGQRKWRVEKFRLWGKSAFWEKDTKFTDGKWAVLSRRSKQNTAFLERYSVNFMHLSFDFQSPSLLSKYREVHYWFFLVYLTFCNKSGFPFLPFSPADLLKLIQAGTFSQGTQVWFWLSQYRLSHFLFCKNSRFDCVGDNSLRWASLYHASQYGFYAQLLPNPALFYYTRRVPLVSADDRIFGVT